MRLPLNIDRITLAERFTSSNPYPPLGFVPFNEGQLGNGDTFGLYWPIGKEDQEPIVAETWHDEWRLVPGYSTLDTFLKATEALDQDDLPQPPSLALDPHSPLACFESAKHEIQAQRVESAVALLEIAVNVLPEFTDALGLLAEQYIRLGEGEKACEVALRAIISPPCFGQRPLKSLRWLASQKEAPPPLAEDPIWRVRGQLRLLFGGVKENPDYSLLLEAIEGYITQGQTAKALTLMQTYGQLMSGETVSFQERHRFRSSVFLAEEIKISRDLRGGPRELVQGNR